MLAVEKLVLDIFVVEILVAAPAVDDSRVAAFVLDRILHGSQCEFDVAVVEVSDHLVRTESMKQAYSTCR